MAHHYPNDKYPTLALLTLYSICVNAGSSLFPIMVTEANAQMFKLSDAMCRQVTGTRGWSTGYGNLIAFEIITKKILEDYPPNKANSLYKVWKEGYCHAQALMLVLSDEFEQAMWDYDMCDDPEELGITSGALGLMKALSGASEKMYAQVQEREELELQLERIKLVQSEHNELHPPTNTGKLIIHNIYDGTVLHNL